MGSTWRLKQETHEYLGLGEEKRLPNRTPPRSTRWRVSDVIYVAAVVLVFFLAAHGLFRKITWYLAIDQYGYLTFAGDLAQGRVFHRWPPVELLASGIEFPRVDVRAQTYVFTGDRMFCRYTPGFPILLAAWISLFGPDAAHYIDPILFLVLLAVHLQLSRRVFASVEGVRWLALGGTLFLLLLPSYLHLWAITILRDITAQLLAVMAILLALPRGAPMSLGRAAGIGFTLGYLITTRVDAGLFALPVGVLFLWQRRQRGAIPLAAALFVAGLSPLLAYNYAATGNPLRPTQAMELERFFQSRRSPSEEPQTSVAARPRPPALPSEAVSHAASDGLRVAAPSPAPLQVASRRGANGRRTVSKPALPPVQGGGLKLHNLPRTLPGNLRYLSNAFGSVIILLAVLGAVTALVTNRLLFMVTVPYCLAALVFYSCWGRPDPRYLAGIFVLTPLLALGGLTWLAGLGRTLRSKVGQTAGPLIAVAVAAALAIAWRGELWAPVSVIGTAWEAGGWRGGSALPVVSGVVALLAIMVTGSGGLRRTPQSRWLAVTLVVLLAATAVARAAPGWHKRASFQAEEVERARRTIESIIGPGAVVLTTDEIGRPAENIDYYTHAHALYLSDLERWRWEIGRACRRFLTAGHDVYLLFPTDSERGRDALERLHALHVSHLAHITAAVAPYYFVASRFGTRPLDIYRVSTSAAASQSVP